MPPRAYSSPACALREVTTNAVRGPVRIQVKRVYEPRKRGDGVRILVDRLWPRGVSRSTAGISAWAKDLAPSTTLRRWFAHQPRRWHEFGRRYRAELAAHAPELTALRARARTRTLTLLYAARDTERNHAWVLKAAIEASPDDGAPG